MMNPLLILLALMPMHDINTEADTIAVTDSIAHVEEISDNPLYFRLFVPLTIYNEAMLGLSEERDTMPAVLLPVSPTEYDRDRSLSEQINETLARVYLEHPELVQLTESELKSVSGPVKEAAQNASTAGIAAPTISTANIKNPNAPELVVKKPSFWKYPGTNTIKYTQSSYSDNWYKGGENNHSLLVQLVQEANYARNSMTLDNKLEAKLGYYTTEKNDKTEFKTNEDLFRITSKLGFKAFKYWSYSAQVQAYTQFMDVYEDSGKLKSKFFAPAYCNISVGMDYKPKFKNKDLTLSLQLSPLSYNCRYVSEVELAKRYGIDEGKNFKYSVGSRLEANWKIKFLKDFQWQGKASYYTSYEYVEANWENTLNYSINKYFAIQFFLHWRFDDSVKPDPDLKYHQFKEFLTLNFTYSW